MPRPNKCQCKHCQKAVAGQENEIHAEMNWLLSQLNTAQRRWYAGIESNRLGKDGDRKVARITGLGEITIRKGREEVVDYSAGRLDKSHRRRPGRRTIKERYPDIELVLEGLLADDIAGDPMSSQQWTRRSSRQLSRELEEKGYRVNYHSICGILKRMGFSMRVNAKKRASTLHAPSRDAQFQYIAAQKKAFLAANLPVISVDTKKKELIGNFKVNGRSWCKEPIEVSDYSYPSMASSIAVPYGIYDLAANNGYVYVGNLVDTPEFAATAIRRWWAEIGSRVYSGKSEVLILADGGGSNGTRSRAWKKQVQTQLGDGLGLSVTVCHYPPRCSKYNPIERRLFAQISANWAGKPLLTLEVMLAFIRGTKTETGLSVEACLLEGPYKKGERVSEREMAQLTVQPHAICPAWNYTITPRANVG